MGACWLVIVFFLFYPSFSFALLRTEVKLLCDIVREDNTLSVLDASCTRILRCYELLSSTLYIYIYCIVWHVMHVHCSNISSAFKSRRIYCSSVFLSINNMNVSR